MRISHQPLSRNAKDPAILIKALGNSVYREASQDPPMNERRTSELMLEGLSLEYSTYLYKFLEKLSQRQYGASFKRENRAMMAKQVVFFEKYKKRDRTTIAITLSPLTR